MRSDITHLKLVTGNSSGDLDSLVCSYVKAKLIDLNNGTDSAVISLFHISRSEWKLHPEAILLFKRCGADLNNILFLDELHKSDIKKLSRTNRLSIILTDHNRPESSLSDFEKDIVEIIDHHTVTKPINEKIQRTISNTGSCSTLIAEQFLEMMENCPEMFNEQSLEELANLLYFTIRIDTDHLKGNNNYDLKRDNRALKKLALIISLPVAFIKVLKSEKMNFRDFSLEDHLGKDYKSWPYSDGRYGISTVYISANDITEDNQLESITNSFMKKKGIKILFLMHLLNKPILERELTVTFSKSCHSKNEIISRLCNSEYFSEKENDYIGNKLYFFSQNNPGFSRKKIQPYINILLETLKE